MKRVTILFDDERLYHQLEAEAAKEGRPVKDVIAEALSDWLRRRPPLSSATQEQREEALRRLEEIAITLPAGVTVNDILAEIRDERS